MKKSFLTFIVVLFSSTVSLANNSDFKTTIKLAKQGHTIAQFNLGVMYDEGTGIPQDDIAAVKWYRKAAEQGYTKAQYNLGYMYAEGNGVAQDDVKAVKWFSKAAEKGHTKAQYNLGWMYDNIILRSVAQDDVKAVQWFSKAAEKGHTKAQYNLAQMYYRGRHVPQDDLRAYAWASVVAAQKNSIKEKYIKEKSKKIVNQIRKKLTSNQLTESQKLASDYWEKYVAPFNKRLSND